VKILVFAHWLEVGGTQVNAIELAAELRDAHGHDVLFFATPGPMLELVREKGLRYEPAPAARVHPSPARMRALQEVLRRERPDVVHVWDWWQCLDAFYGTHLLARTPMVVTDMSMFLQRVLPRSLPTTYGTPELVEQARAAGHRRVELLLPPVDLRKNAPGAADGAPFRRAHGIADGELAIVAVSRLSTSMKAEGLRRTVDAVRLAGRDLPLKFVVVGEGNGRPELEALAARVNAELGRPAVLLAGALLDPRPAYAAADVVVGMGGSALRAMAFGKPVVILGERGFSAPFTPETAAGFHHRGMYGLGDGRADNARLAADLRAVAGWPGGPAALGAFSRAYVTRHYALDANAARLERFLRSAAAEAPRLHVAAADGLRTAAVWLRERRFNW
jgi:glycosyltransferase involved in cell wall biosynthesis